MTVTCFIVPVQTAMLRRAFSLWQASWIPAFAGKTGWAQQAFERAALCSNIVIPANAGIQEME